MGSGYIGNIYVHQQVVFSLSVMSDSWPPHGMWPSRLLCPWHSPGKNTGMGCHFLLQGIFPTQGLNLCLLHCRWIFYCLSHWGNPSRWLHIKADQTDLNRELNQEWKKQKHILITVARWSWSDPQKRKQAKLCIHCIKYSAGWMDRKKIWEWRLFLTVRSPGVLCCPKCIFIFGFLYFIFSNILSSPIDNYRIRSRVSPEGNEDTAIPSRHTEDSTLNHTVLCPCGHLPAALGFQGRRLQDPHTFWQEAKGKFKIVIQKYGLILAFT